MKSKWSFILALALVALFASAVVLLAVEDSGRNVLREGSIGTLSGTLKEDNGEWFLEAGKVTYLLHFGNRAYLAGTGMPLKAGKEIAVEGSVLDDDIVVYKATLDGKTYAFRDKDGVPLWMGDRKSSWREGCDEGYGWSRRNRRDRDGGCCGGYGSYGGGKKGR